jgi:hypothetical protein
MKTIRISGEIIQVPFQPKEQKAKKTARKPKALPAAEAE